MFKNKLSWIVFCILAIICFIVFKDYLLLKKVYYFYDICSDGFFSRYPELYNLSDYFENHGIPTWSFKIGMGQNIFPYILNEPFDIILYLGGKDNILPLTVYVEVAKILCAGMVFFYYLRTINLSKYTCIAGALLFAFCGFITEGSAWFGFTFEAFNFAVILLGFELFFVKKRWWLFPFSIFLVCISMPFNLWIYSLFFALYSILRLIQTENFGIKKLALLYAQLAGLGVLGMLLAGPFLMQNIWMLLHSPRGSNSGSLLHTLKTTPIFKVSDNLQLGTSILRFFSNDILGSSSYFKGWDTILGAGLFYIGLPCLLLFPQVFPFLKLRIRVVFITFLVLWILPIIFPFFRSAFWLFAGDYYRNYSFFVAFIILYYSLQALDLILRESRINLWLLAGTLIVLLVVLFHPFFIDKKSIDTGIRTFVTIMLVAYCCLLALIGNIKNARYFVYLFLSLIFVEVCYSGWITANKRDAFGLDWLKGKVVYTGNTYDAVKLIQSRDNTFFRIDKNFDPPSSRYSDLNFSQRQGYNSTTSYNSFNQLYYINYLKLMGAVDKDNEEESRYAIGLLNNPILETEDRVKYFMGINGFHPSWPEMWDSVGKIDNVTVFKNKEVLPFGIGYSRFIRQSNFDLASPLQKKFITLQAVVLKDKDIDKVSRLKEFSLQDTIRGPLTFDEFASKLNELRKDSLELTSFEETKFEGYVNFSEDKMLYLPIPYDDGWQLIVDITEMKPILLDGGMMGVFLEKGRHHIDLFYKLRFMVKGAAMSLLAIALILGVWYFTVYRKRKDKFQLPDFTNSSFTTSFTLKSVAIIFLVLFIWYFRWRTTIVYGDDLALWQLHGGLKTFLQTINCTLTVGKYRPIYCFVFNLLIDIFGKSPSAFFLFNIAVQSVVTLVCAFILNLFFRSRVISVLFSLIIGLSPFSYFNISQLLNGGALEGLAMLFFVLSLYYLIKAVLPGNDDSAKQKRMMLSILFANLSVYTHERYIGLFAFIFLVCLLFPSFKGLPLSTRVKLASYAVISILANIFIKKFLFHSEFLVGTGGKQIDFSPSQTFPLFAEAVKSIFQYNSGPEYLAGITFSSLPLVGKVITSLLITSIIVLLITFFFVGSARAAGQGQEKKANFFIFTFLIILLLCCVVPAVITQRLEQRWLQAPLFIIVLMLAIAFIGTFRNIATRNMTVIIFAFLFIWVNHNYFTRGVQNLYFTYSEREAFKFKEAIDNGTIHPAADTLYIWEKKRNIEAEQGLSWTLGSGYFFDFYQAAPKHLAYVDSIYLPTGQSALPGFNPKTQQVLYFSDLIFANQMIYDMTHEYLEDSLKSFSKKIRQ